MLGETAVALVIALASSMGVGGAAWLLMYKPLGQAIPQPQAAPAHRQQPAPAASINWACR